MRIASALPAPGSGYGAGIQPNKIRGGSEMIATHEERTSPRGTEVLRDMTDGGYVIYWNGSATFSVWSALGNDFSVRTLREVNVFTNYDAADIESAQTIAASWWAGYGRESTEQVEREGLF